MVLDWEEGSYPHCTHIAVSAVMCSLFDVGKMELHQKAKLLVYQSIYVLILNYGNEIWVILRRTRSRLQAAKVIFLLLGCWVNHLGHSEELRVEKNQ